MVMNQYIQIAIMKIVHKADTNVLKFPLVQITGKYVKIFIFLINKCGHRNVLSKRQVWMSIFHIINFKKKKSWTQGPGFFIIKN
jgi:hypothetical protein